MPLILSFDSRRNPFSVSPSVPHQQSKIAAKSHRCKASYIFIAHSSRIHLFHIFSTRFSPSIKRKIPRGTRTKELPVRPSQDPATKATTAVEYKMNLETDLANYMAWVQRNLVRLFNAVIYQERNLRQEAERRIISLQNEIVEMRQEIARLHGPITELPNIQQRLSVSGGQTERQSNMGPQSRREVPHTNQGLPA